MRHYEIVFLVHPDQSEQVPAMIERYRVMIEEDGGHPVSYTHLDVYKRQLWDCSKIWVQITSSWICI